MSIINKMLQDLDRRQGASDRDATLVQQVRSVPPPRKEREWFWRIIAVLMIVALGWVAWIAWQLRPRDPVATEQAFKAAQNAARNPPPAPAPAAPQPAAQEPAAQKPAAEAKPVAEKPAPQVVETMKLAPGIETPIREQPPAPAIKAPAQALPPPAAAAAPVAAAKAGVSAAATTKVDLDVPPERILQAPAQAQGPARVEKKDRVRMPEERAESDFRRGAALLSQGRATEAEEVFGAAITAYPGHEAARQALVALHLEQGRIDEARRLLQEGMALNPGNTRFASVLARIHIERRAFAAALDVMNGVKAPEQGGAEFQSMRGTVLQQLGRHAEAADAFQSALRGAPQNGAVWMGLGISLETLGRKPEAADAFRRAAATETLGAEARGYAEQRARQLR